MFSKNELRYVLALQRVPNLGDASAKKLIHKLGSAEAVFNEKIKNLSKIDGIGAFKLKDLNKQVQLDAADEELEFIEQEGIELCYFLDKNYPDHLKHCYDAPILLFSKGNIDLKHKKLISIVGTRNATSYGTYNCERLIAELAPLNPVIISGFAYGIDITAHKTALKYNLQTIACLAHGLNQFYPRNHEKYVPRILENGGLFTEFWSSDAFDRTNFLKRNRIIAGLSEATVVIESAEKGGSLVTADIANSYNREVFALPGRISDRMSTGCNDLIKTNQAHLLSLAADLVYLLGWQLQDSLPKKVQTELFPTLSEDETLVMNMLRKSEKEELDLIALNCNLPTYKVASLLLNLELKGLVQPLPGKVFQAI